MKFITRLVWSGAAQEVTRSTAGFSRDLEVSFGDRDLSLSAAPEFRGDASRANPEQLFVAAISSCHALTYLFLAARHGIAVRSYIDDAEGELEMVDGRMRMTSVTLRPRIVIEQGSEARARELVDKAHHGCFIANSITTAVTLAPLISSQPATEEVAS
jgi:organic hydroperoxide reductase OsmC/OhrA